MVYTVLWCATPALTRGLFIGVPLHILWNQFVHMPFLMMIWRCSVSKELHNSERIYHLASLAICFLFFFFYLGRYVLSLSCIIIISLNRIINFIWRKHEFNNLIHFLNFYWILLFSPSSNCPSVRLKMSSTMIYQYQSNWQVQ